MHHGHSGFVLYHFYVHNFEKVGGAYCFWLVLYLFVHLFVTLFTASCAGRGSSVGCASAWYTDGRGFDPHARQHFFAENGHEIISTVMLSLPLIQEGLLSVTVERMCTAIGKLPRKLAQEHFG